MESFSACNKPYRDLHVITLLEGNGLLSCICTAVKYCTELTTVLKAQYDLKSVQDALMMQPNDSLILQEKEALSELKVAKTNLYMMLQQKSKLSWLRCGDDNSKVFYQALKTRRRQNKVHAIHNKDGVWVNKREEVDAAFVDFYKDLFSEREQKHPVLDTVIDKGKKLTERHRQIILR